MEKRKVFMKIIDNLKYHKIIDHSKHIHFSGRIYFKVNNGNNSTMCEIW